MSIPQEQQDRLIAYFEGTLSAEDEIEFLHEVNGNEALQKEFDWELLLRYRQFNKLNEAGLPEEFEPADAHINRVKEALKRSDETEPAPRKPIIRFRKFVPTAAIFLVVLAGALFYLLYFKNSSPELVHRDPPVQPDSGRLHKKENPQPPESPDRALADNKEKAEKTYKQYYKKYTGSEEDPIQVSKFLYAYNKGRYNEVINGAAGELLSKGGSTNTATLKTYLSFYQGISYLHVKKSVPAITKLREALNAASAKDPVYYDASWYLAMTYLQCGDLTGAKPLLKRLADNKVNNGYKKKAAELLKLS